MIDPTCEVCNDAESVGVCCMPGVPMSVAYCRGCMEANVHPYGILVANTACVGGLKHAAEWWRLMVNNTLDYFKDSHGRSKEQFLKDVQEAMDDMGETHLQEQS